MHLSWELSVTGQHSGEMTLLSTIKICVMTLFLAFLRPDLPNSSYKAVRLLSLLLNFSCAIVSFPLFGLLFFIFIYLFCFVVFCLFAFSRATPAVYGGSQVRGRIGAVATGLRQSHSNLGSKPHLQPTPQLTATPDP